VSSEVDGASGTRMYPLLPCRDVDEAIAFYEALGFTRTYRQVRPNPHAVVERGELAVHLFGMDGFDPAGSYGSVIITVPDPDALYAAFAAGLRAAYGHLPVAGIPRMVRPRKRWGTVYGFSVVDVGGNWLRISKTGDSEAAPDATEPGLARSIEVAARLADAKGDDAQALKTLVGGLERNPDAPALERGQALLYRAELEIRLGLGADARVSLGVAEALDLDQDERSTLADDLAHVTELLEAAG
jgi:catechol 2,3-dioxygenase-like lactoylglutathione lyase family enzyme